MMNGDCECGECKSCKAALKTIKKANARLFRTKKGDKMKNQQIEEDKLACEQFGKAFGLTELTTKEDKRRQVVLMHEGV